MTVDRCKRHGHQQVNDLRILLDKYYLCWAFFGEAVAGEAEMVHLVDSYMRAYVRFYCNSTLKYEL